MTEAPDRQAQTDEARQAATGRPFLPISVWLLIAVNAGVLWMALAQGLSFLSLMLIYWIQSAIIGVSYLARLLLFKGDAPDVKRKAIIAFVLIYGLLLVLYLGLIAKFAKEQHIDLGAPATWGWCALGFAASQALSLRRNLAADAAAVLGGDAAAIPELSSIVAVPIVRVVPMHFLFFVGAFLCDFGVNAIGLMIFGALKTAADVLMHVLEHDSPAPRQPERG